MSEKTAQINVPDFFAWCEAQGHELPAFNEQPASKDATSESGSARRAAIRSHAYPAGYGRGQYPKGYFTPTAADTLVYDKDNH